MFFLFEIGSRARNAGRFLNQVRGEILKAVTEEKSSAGLTQHALASKLGVERKALNRLLLGEGRISLRLLSDFAWALNREVHVELRKPERRKGQNEPPQYHTAESRKPQIVGSATGWGMAVRTASTRPNG